MVSDRPNIVRGGCLGLLATVMLCAGSLSGCSSTQCESDSDCSAGRVCRLNLCAIDYSQGVDGVGVDGALVDVDLPCDPAVPGDLLMNEILADPGGQDVNGDGNPSPTANEFIEIVNVSGKTIGISNASIRVTASSTKNVSLGYRCLEPYESRTVFGSEISLGLTNSGATVALLIDGLVVESTTYGPEAGKDQSITRTIQLDPTSGWTIHTAVAQTTWSPGACANGKPFPDCEGGVPLPTDVVGGDVDGGGVDAGVPDCGVPKPVFGDVLINEVLADPGNNDANQDGVVNNDDEFVEIVNVSGHGLDLGKVSLSEGAGKKIVFPLGICLEPHQAVLVFGNHYGGGDYGGALVLSYGGAFGLNNDGDSLTLLDATGQVLAQMSYGKEGGKDQSLTRQVDLDFSSPFVQHSAAPKAEGATMSPGRCQNGNPLPDC